MRKLVLIKHALPDIDKTIPSREWRLSADGAVKSRLLSQYIKKYNVQHVYTSDERKAMETGEVICKELNLKLRVEKNLHENDRTGLKYLTHEELESTFRSFFANPGDRIVGNETADAAKNRFADTVKCIVENDDKEQDVVIAAHGTVISLFVSCFNDIDTFGFWDSLGLPSLIELTIPDFKLINVIKTI